MIHPNLNINKAFREQVEKIIITIFGAITQNFIIATFSNKKTRVLTLQMLYETRAENISYKVLSCVIYTILKSYVCIDYLACQ